MSKSIIQTQKECYICRYLAAQQGYYGELPSAGLHKHHIMFGIANRKKSEHFGLWVYLCVPHHEYGPDAVHSNRDVRIFLCQIGQQVFEQKYSHEKYMQEFGRDWMCEKPTGKWKQEKTEHKEGRIELLDIDLGELPF